MKCLRLSTLALGLALISEGQLAFARAGKSRGFSRPSRSTPSSSDSYAPRSGFGQRPQDSYAPRTAPQPALPQTPTVGRPSLLKTFGTAVAGGLLGSMLFRALGGSTLPGGAGGIGILEILLIAGGLFLLFRFLRQRTPSPQTYPASYGETPIRFPEVTSAVRSGPDLTEDTASDIFFKIQAAYTKRDLSPVSNYLTKEAFQVLQSEIDELKALGHLNKLENIAVRSVVTSPAADGYKAEFQASLLDYVTNEKTGEVVSGNPNDPVKFSETWFFIYDYGWKLDGIDVNH